MDKLPREFYLRDTLTVARELLGKLLVCHTGKERLVCRIAETEAYIAANDKACHAYQYHRTKRNEVMFAQGGTAYIYQIYGMYFCLNLVTEPKGEPCAVLIRGMQPVEGTDVLSRNRFGVPFDDLSPAQRKNFLNGPGKVCRALRLTREQNGADLTGNMLHVADAPAPDRINVGTRIGIDYAEEARDFPWRFWI